MTGYESRPELELEAADDCVAAVNHSVGATDDVDRCTRCKHPIRAAESLRLGLGPVCRREVAA